MKILVTGANGFVGSFLVARLAGEGVETIGAVRSGVSPCGETFRAGDMGGSPRWRDALVGVDVVVHLAARVHVMREREKDPLTAFRRVNLQGTVDLARQAAGAGVRRLVYVSTVKVLGEDSGPEPFSDSSPCSPADPYAVSKHEAEEALFAVSAETGMEVVVLRPPLVYGPGVGGNFLRLLRLARTGVPMPFGLVDNRRSMIHVENLVDALCLCTTARDCAGRAWLVCDGEDLSTAGLFRRLRWEMGMGPRLVPVPPRLLSIVACVAGLGREMARLTGSLVIDDSGFRAETGWRPPVSVVEGLRNTVAWFLAEKC